jgi:Ca2+:H+ antiporter
MESTDRRSRLPRENSIGSMDPFKAKYASKLIAKREGSHRGDADRFSSERAASERTPLTSTGQSILEDQSAAGYLKKEGYDTISALKDIVFGKIISALLLLAPVAVLAHVQGWSPVWIFWLNFLVMIPLAAILGDFTEEVALHTNQTIGGLVNATFGNAVEVVVAIQALMANEIRVVQATMIGSIFSNLLLVLGCCFFFGGIYHKEQSFNGTAATSNMALLSLSSIALVLPTPFAAYYEVQDEDVLAISRFAAVFLMFMYVQLLIFQLSTHSYLFEDEGGDQNEEDEDGEKEEEELATISMPVAIAGLVTVTLLVTFFSSFLVDSIGGFCESSGVSRTFVGLIILPIVGNAVEHITAVTVAMKDKMDLAMGGVCIYFVTRVRLIVALVRPHIFAFCSVLQSLSDLAHRFLCLLFP